MINDVIDLKNQNAKAVLDLIRFSDSYTKKDIADLSGLSITTVSTICSELKEKNIVSEEKVASSRIGRIPNCIVFHYNAFFVVGIDLQIYNTLGLGISNFRNELLFSESYDISKVKTIPEIAKFAKDVIDHAVEKIGISRNSIVGTGISVPAIFDAVDSKLVSSSIPAYNGVDVKHIFEEILHLPVYVDNSSNFKAVSVYTRTKESNIVCLDIAQGTGVGVICNNALLRGKNGYGAEVAHLPIGNPSLICPSCGSHGCIEAELQITHFLTFYPDYDPQAGPETQWKTFVEIIRNNPAPYAELLSRTGFLVGSLTSLLINLFDPSVFIITGYIADLFPLFQDVFTEQLRMRSALSLSRGLKIQVEPYHNDGIYEGICDTIYDQWNPLE